MLAHVFILPFKGTLKVGMRSDFIFFVRASPSLVSFLSFRALNLRSPCKNIPQAGYLMVAGSPFRNREYG
ncbi:MAG: hypothetical protein ABJB85_11460 [Nitrososphaerota archaeon]